MHAAALGGARCSAARGLTRPLGRWCTGFAAGPPSSPGRRAGSPRAAAAEVVVEICCACARAWRLGSTGCGLWARDRSLRLNTSIPSRRSSIWSCNRAFVRARRGATARARRGSPVPWACRLRHGCQRRVLPRPPHSPQSAAEGSLSRGVARACAPRPTPGASVCREHGRRSQRPSGCRRPGHAESGAAGSAATTVSLRGALVGRAVHTVACKRHCVPLRVGISRPVWRES